MRILRLCARHRPDIGKIVTRSASSLLSELELGYRIDEIGYTNRWASRC